MPSNVSEGSLKKVFHHPATVRALAFLISSYMYVVFATCRVRVITVLPEPLASGPVVLASWHQQIPMVPIMRRRNPAQMLALVASSRAGKVWYSIVPVEGSSRTGRRTAVRALVKALVTGAASISPRTDRAARLVSPRKGRRRLRA